MLKMLSIKGQSKPIFVLIMAIIAKVSLILGKISLSYYSKSVFSIFPKPRPAKN